MTDLRSAVNDYLAVRRQPGSPEVMSKSGAGCTVARVPISISGPDLHRRARFRARGQLFRRALRAPLEPTVLRRPTRTAMPTPISGALRLFGNLGFLPTGVNESITIAATTFLGEEAGGASLSSEAKPDPN